MNKKLLLIITILFFFSSYGFSEDAKDSRVFVFIMNRTNIDDINKMDNFKKIIFKGAFGIMNTRASDGYDSGGSYLTINSTQRAFVKKNIIINKGIDGRVKVDVNPIKKVNVKNYYSPEIGVLGDSIHELGLKTAVFGNSDTAESFIRLNTLLAIDSEGIIDYGFFDSINRKNINMPYFYSTDYNKLMSLIRNIDNEVGFLVIEFGDLNRIYQNANNINYDDYLHYRNKILLDIDSFLLQFLEGFNKQKDLLIILSPNQGDENISNSSKLSPVYMYGKNIPSGIIYSNTTKRKGVLSNLDIAPSILRFFNVDTKEFDGNPLEVIEDKDNYSFVKGLSKRIDRISYIRKIVIKRFGYISLILLLLLLFLLKINFNISIINISINIIPIFTLTAITYPITYLSFEKAVYYMVIILILSMLSLKVVKDSLLRLFFLQYGVIVFDLIMGSILIKNSILGYDPIIGARYFGIGNELAGIYIVSFLLVFISSFNEYKKIIMLTFIFSILILLSPNMGANMGSTIAISVSMFYYYIKELKVKEIIKILIAVTIIFLFILYFSDTYSHLNKTFIHLINRGYTELFDIVIRKISMNLKLLGISIWSDILYGSIVLISFILLVFKKEIKYILNFNKNILLAIDTSLIASLIGFLFNDSGVVLSSLLNIFLLAFMIKFISNQRKTLMMMKRGK